MMKKTTQQHIEYAIQLLKQAVPDGIPADALRQALGVCGRRSERVVYGLSQFPIGHDARLDDTFYWVGR